MERRSFPRFELNAPLRVSILGDDCQHEGFVLNVSQSGLRLMSAVAFPEGEVVRVEVNDHILVGTVRHGDLHEGRYGIGVELHSVINKLDFGTMLDELAPEFVLS